MTRTSPPQVSFASGEIDPLLHRRFDYQRFQSGLAICRGYLPLAQGGFTRAPGTLYKGNTPANAEGALLPFTFAVNDAVVLEFTNLQMRVWRYGQLVMSGPDPYVLTTPYPLASLQKLQWVQSADVIYLADGMRPIQKLSRLALNNWTISDFKPNTGPFRVQNLTKTLTVQASAATGSVTLTASSALFAANHIGSLIELKPTDNTAVPLWTSGEETMSVGNLRRYGRNVYQLTVTGGRIGSNPPIHEEGEEATDNSTKWLFLSNDIGVARITAVASGTSATATVLQRLPKAVVDSPTYRWSEGAWSDRYGYPATLEIYDQRLAAAATASEPRTVWFSTAGDFSDFAPSVEADGAFAYTIAGDNTVNRILNLARGTTGLHILALGEEYSTRSDSRAQVIGPTTAVFTTNSKKGSHTARPIAPDGSPIFISRDRRRLIMMNYSIEAEGARPVILSRASQHLGADPFEQIVWQSSPEPMGWLRRASGDLATMVFDAAEEVLGWATVPIAGGFCEAMAVTPNADGTADEVMMIVRRTINGETVRFIEIMTPIFGLLDGSQNISDACHFFASSELTAEPAARVFSVPHLIDQTVYAWTDNGEFGPLQVTAEGEVTLPADVGHAFIGLFDDTHFAETLDIQAAAADGNTMGRAKRLHSKFGVGLHNTAQGYIQVVERDFAQTPRLSNRRFMVARGVAATLTQTAYSGVTQIPDPSGFATELALRFSPCNGAPMTVTAIVPIVQEAGR
jgi:hypothetical protein